MTDQEIIDYYKDLLIMQYKGKERARATIDVLVSMVVMNQLPTQVQDGFDVETAEGTQLDVIGKYAGVTRYGSTFDGDPITLTDSDYRQLIRMAIVKNSAGSSLYDIQNLLITFFPNQIYVYEIGVMQLSYFLNGGVGSIELAQMFILQDLLPKPMGVQLASVIYLLITDNLFGMRTYARAGTNIHGFNTYQVYDEDCHWLSYTDTIPL